MKTFKRKAEILAQHQWVLQTHNAHHTICSKIEAWMTAGAVTQLNLPLKPFNKPSGQGYVGRGHGTHGFENSCVDLHWGSTYNGCREYDIDIEKLILTLRIYDGDMTYGRRTDLRGEWKFKLNFEWYEDPDFSVAINGAWNRLIDEKFEEEEVVRKKNALRRIEESLLTA